MIFLENIGYLLTLFGDWQRGPALIRKAIEANPYYSSNVHHYALGGLGPAERLPAGPYDETLAFQQTPAVLGSAAESCKPGTAGEK
jgi:hypothetical protein